MKVLAFAALLIPPLVASASQSSPQTGEQLFQELSRALSGGNRQAIVSYVRTHFTGDAIKGESEKEIDDYLSSLWDKTRGLTPKSYKNAQPGSWTVITQSNLNGQWIRLSFEVDAKSGLLTAFDWSVQYAPREKAGAVTQTDQAIVRELSEYMQKLERADTFSGDVILAKGDKVLYQAAIGEADKRFHVRMRNDTKLNLASLNKMFTGVAIAQLVENGKLSFSDTLDKFLPDFPVSGAAKSIRIEHLLTHSSGLRGYMTQEFYDANPNKFRTLDDFMKLVKPDPLAFEPGTDRRYSNTGYLVLGRVIEKVTGMSYYDYVDQHVFKPAGMVNTGSFELDGITPNLATGYEKEYTETGIRFRSNAFVTGIRGTSAGGGYSTTEDLRRFSQALQNGKLLSPSMLKRIWTPRPDLHSPYYGFGFGVLDDPLIIAHSGGDTGVSTDFEIFPEKGYTFAVLSNYTDAGQQVALKFREVLSRQK